MSLSASTCDKQEGACKFHIKSSPAIKRNTTKDFSHSHMVHSFSGIKSQHKAKSDVSCENIKTTGVLSSDALSSDTPEKGFYAPLHTTIAIPYPSVLTVHNIAHVVFPVQIRLPVCDRGHENLSKDLPGTLLTDLTLEV